MSLLGLGSTTLYVDQLLFSVMVFHLLHREASLMTGEEHTYLWLQEKKYLQCSYGLC